MRGCHLSRLLLPAARGVSPGISTHADAGGIHNWQEHLLVTLMGLGARFAEPATLVVDTLRADLGRRFAAYPARDQRGSIPGEHLDGLAFRFTVFFCEHLHAQLRCGAEIILVKKLEPRTEHFVEPHAHTFFVWLPIRIHARV